jgi:hypothetical protein
VLSGEAKRKSVPSGEDNNKRIEYSLVNFWDILIMTLLSVLWKFYLIPIFNSIWFAYKMYMLIMHLFSTIQTTVYANHDRKCDIESICFPHEQFSYSGVWWGIEENSSLRRRQ